MGVIFHLRKRTPKKINFWCVYGPPFMAHLYDEGGGRNRSSTFLCVVAHLILFAVAQLTGETCNLTRSVRKPSVLMHTVH